MKINEFTKRQENFSWQPSDNCIKISTIDTHAAGEPLRIIYDSFPELNGNTILQRRRQAKENFDHLRKALMWEPRGHADMYGCILMPPVTPEADFGVLFTHNEGFSTMCGHGIIAVTTALLETGFYDMREPQTVLRIDTPAGLITATAHIQGKRVEKVSFLNVPSFVLARDLQIDIPGIGMVHYDIAFGGAFYAFVNADELNIMMTPENNRSLIEAGMAIKKAVMATQKIQHPFEEDLNFLYGTVFTGRAHDSQADSRNVCIFAEGEVDRSPTGTGVSARMALHYARGDIKEQEEMIIESIIGSRFSGKVAKVTTFGPYEAVIPEVSGSAYITGKHSFLIDPEDPLNEGFILR